MEEYYISSYDSRQVIQTLLIWLEDQKIGEGKIAFKQLEEIYPMYMLSIFRDSPERSYWIEEGG